MNTFYMEKISKGLLLYYPLVFILLSGGCTNKTSIEELTHSSSTIFENPPEWAKEVVWYQIFVERFRNGDPSNDPTPTDIEGSYPGYIPGNWKITPWTQDWYKPDEYFAQLEGIKDFGGYTVSMFDQKVQLRRYGGDLQGVLDKIDYLDSLGVTAIYFNPLNDAPSLHKYDARHWRHIDRNFGPDPSKDRATIANENPEDPTTWIFTEADKLFLKVIEEFHKRQIKVILDYSWNHTGHTFWAWQDVIKNQKSSKYADWFTIDQFDNPTTPQNEFKFRGWAGVNELPEIKKTVHQDHSSGIKAYEGNLYSHHVKDHIFNITHRWLDPNGDGDPSDGVDGFRLDVAAEVPLGFWRDYRKFVRNINPNAILIGEIWWEKWPDKLLEPEPFLRGDIFDAPMNYRWYRSARHFFNASPEEISVSTFVDSLTSYKKNIREANNYAMMNLTSSHDVPRTLTSLFNKTRYKYQAKPEDNPSYKIHKPEPETYQTLKLLLAHQFTYIGAPHIWAGDEMGMWGADDPSTRKPLIWKDYNFEPETNHPLGQSRPRDEVIFDDELFLYYQKLIKLRKDNRVLINGKIDFIKIDDTNKILAYSRYNDYEEVIAIFNTSTENKLIELPVKANKTYKDKLENLPAIKAKNNTIQLEIFPRSTAILVIE
jgi:cyclomaltodextrinase / maltogenic alpha-amylase / neopullulanase